MGEKHNAFKKLEYVIPKLLNKDHFDKSVFSEIIMLAYFMNKATNRSEWIIEELLRTLEIEIFTMKDNWQYEP